MSIEKSWNKNSRAGWLLFILLVLLLLAVSSHGMASEKNNNDSSITDASKTNLSNTPKTKSTLTKSKAGVAQKPQHLLVKFKDGISSVTKNTLHQKTGSRIKKSLKMVPGVQVIELAPGVSAPEVLKQYQKDPSVLYAEPDYKIKLKAIPNDTSFSQLWGLNNTGQTGGSSNADINAPEAWDVTHGSNSVVVAVVDTGIDYTHLDLVDNVWTNPGEIAGNGIDDDGNGYIDDIHGIDTGDGDSDPMDTEGHGTHVSGTIGARGNNNLGVAGVNWNVSIIGCKIFSSSAAQDLEAFVSDAIECLDYLYDLKMNHGVDIVATNNSWGWIGNPSQTLIDAVDRQREAGILFVAAAGNESLNTDQFLDNPSGYYVPNVISVAASTHTDALASFSNFGRRSVHVAAPGQDILSTVPDTGGGSVLPPATNPHDEIFIDNVESGAGNWSAQSPWAITTSNSYNGSSSWSDSPGTYANNVNTSLTSATMDLSSYAGQSVYLGFYASYQIETNFDYLFVEISNNGGATWSQLDTLTGTSSGWQFFSNTIPQAYLTSTFKLRFRFETDLSITYDGVYIDDIGIGTTPYVPTPAAGSNTYDTLSGTSMATPHVVGLLALLKAQDPSRNWHQLKNLVISSGTPLGVLAANTVSGRRIRAYDTNNTGGMTCSNQTVLSRLQPRTDEYGIEPGDLVNVSMLNINCGEPAGNLSVTIAETGDTVALLDDGTGYDQVAGDGIYSAQIDLGAMGLSRATIQFPDSSSVIANTVYRYNTAMPNTYQWRDISGVGQPVFTGDTSGLGYDDQTNYINTPFSIPFANTSAPYNRIGIDTNGYVVMQWVGESQLQFSIFENFQIPLVGVSNMVAVFWDDLVADNDSNVIWGVLGSAPERELVITWQNMRPYNGSQGISFQVVFAENSSDVIFNYQDTIIPLALTDNGISATSGIQVASGIGTQYSFNTASLASGTSLRWSMPSGVVNTPTIPPPPPPAVRPSPGGGGSSGFMVLLLLPMILIRRLIK